MALAQEPGGALWAGTEDQGVWRWDGAAWRGFTTRDGLGDDNGYALCVDRAGRVLPMSRSWRSGPGGQTQRE